MTRVHLEVVDLAGRPTVLEVKVRIDFVECWLGGRCLAMVDRGLLAEWALGRREEVASGELVLVHSLGGAVVEAPGALKRSPLTPTSLHRLRELVT